MMKVKDYLKVLNLDDVLESLFELYPGQEKNIIGYKNAWKELKSLEPEQPEEGNLKVLVAYRSEEAHPHFDVSGIVENSDMLYAIEFMPWEQWLDCDVILNADATMKIKSPEETFAHILWEMTFAGYSNTEVKVERDGILSEVNEIKQSLKDE